MPSDSILPTAERTSLTGTNSADEPPSLVWQLTGVFYAPRRLFLHLRREPSWMAPLLTAIAVGILVIVLLPDQVFYESMQGATTRRGEPVAITSDPSAVALWERLRLTLGVVVTHPLKAIMIAGFLTLVFGRLLGGAGEFRHHLAITSHALLISALGALLVLPFQVVHADPSWQLSLAQLSSDLPSSGLGGRTLALVNPFTVWMLAVLAVGVAVVDRRPFLISFAVLLGLYFAATLGVTSLQA